MTTAKDFLLIDFGVAWTKGFLVSQETESNFPKLILNDSQFVPTTIPEIEIGYKEIFKKLKPNKDVKVILTSSLVKKEALTPFTNDLFVDTDAVYRALKEFFGRSFFDVVFVDGGASNWLQNFDPSLVAAFTSKRVTEVEIENYLGNKRRYLFTVPTGETHLDIETAFLKNYMLTRGVPKGNKNTLVIATGGLFSYSNNSGLILETLVDKLSAPLCQILLDTSGFLPAFGALLSFAPEKKEILQVPSLKNLAAIINLGGPGHLNIGFSEHEFRKIAVGVDQITILEAPKDKEILLKSINKEVLDNVITVGELGVVIDGRGKPLDLVPNSDLGKEKIKKWREVYSKQL